MSTFTNRKPLCDRSENNLKGVQAPLVRVVRRAATIIPFQMANETGELPPGFVRYVVIDGKRPAHLQKAYFEAGKSRTLDSHHLTGHAIDIAAFDGDGQPLWEPWRLYQDLTEAMMQAAHLERVPLQWGGHFARQRVTGFIDPFRDGVHFQIPRACDMLPFITDAELIEEIARRSPEIPAPTLANFSKQPKKRRTSKKSTPGGQKSPPAGDPKKSG